jgi:hypothetical protein
VRGSCPLFRLMESLLFLHIGKRCHTFHRHLLTYKSVSTPSNQHFLPINIKPQIYFNNSTGFISFYILLTTIHQPPFIGRMDISVQSRLQDKPITNILLQIHVPDTILSIQTTCTVGKANYFRKRNVLFSIVNIFFHLHFNRHTLWIRSWSGVSTR